jgi:archaellum biogenesis ATPase FlaH
MLRMATTEDAITTGIKAISEALGGGIRPGSLVLIEGEAKTGKSILSQHLAHGTLNSKKHSVAYYTTEKKLDDFLHQMNAMSLDVKHDFVTDRLRVYNIGLEKGKSAQEYLQLLVKHFLGLPERFKLIIVDSVTPMMTAANPAVKIDFFQACKETSKEGRSIILVMGTHVMDGKTLNRAYAMSDYYLKLRSKDAILGRGQVDERQVKILEVTKLCGAERHGQQGINFEIKPRIGIQILPFVTVRA